MRNLLTIGLIALFVLAPVCAFAGSCCSEKKACTCAKCASSSCDTGVCRCGCGK